MLTSAASGARANRSSSGGPEIDSPASRSVALPAIPKRSVTSSNQLTACRIGLIAGKLLDEAHVEPEPLKAADPAHPDPRLAARAGLVGERSRDDDARHATPRSPSSRGRTARGREVLLGERASGAAVTLVVTDDLLRARDGLLECLEGDEPLAGWHDIVEAGVLDEHRTPARQVAGASVAEPAAPGVDVQVLGDHQLRRRALNVVAVAPRIAGRRARVGESPAVLREGAAIRFVGLVDVQRDLELCREPAPAARRSGGTRARAGRRFARGTRAGRTGLASSPRS